MQSTCTGAHILLTCIPVYKLKINTCTCTGVTKKTCQCQWKVVQCYNLGVKDLAPFSPKQTFCEFSYITTGRVRVPLWLKNHYFVQRHNYDREYPNFAPWICAKYWEERYEDLLQLFNLPAMSEHRLNLDLCTIIMFNIVHGFFYFPSIIILLLYLNLNPGCKITLNTVIPLLFHRS